MTDVEYRGAYQLPTLEDWQASSQTTIYIPRLQAELETFQAEPPVLVDPAERLELQQIPPIGRAAILGMAGLQGADQLIEATTAMEEYGRIKAAEVAWAERFTNPEATSDQLVKHLRGYSEWLAEVRPKHPFSIGSLQGGIRPQNMVPILEVGLAKAVKLGNQAVADRIVDFYGGLYKNANKERSRTSPEAHLLRPFYGVITKAIDERVLTVATYRPMTEATLTKIKGPHQQAIDLYALLAKRGIVNIISFGNLVMQGQTGIPLPPFDKLVNNYAADLLPPADAAAAVEYKQMATDFSKAILEARLRRTPQAPSEGPNIATAKELMRRAQ